MDQSKSTSGAPGSSPKLAATNGVGAAKPTPVASTPKPTKARVEDDEDDVPIGQLVKSSTPAKPSATTPKLASSNTAKAATKPTTPASSKPAATTPSAKTAAKPANGGVKVEKTTDTKDEKTTTATGTKNTTVTTTTTKTTTPTSTKTTTVTDTLTTTTPKKAAIKKESKADDSDDDKPLSSLASEKKTTTVKTEKKDNAVVTKEKTTVVKRDVKEEKKTPVKKAPAKKRKAASDSEEDDFSSEEEKKPKKKTKKRVIESDSESESDSDDEPISKKVAAKKKKKGDDDEEPKKKKKKDKEGEEEQWKWWLEAPLPDGKKWTSLVHNGVMFVEPYVPHKVKFYYDGKPVDLSPAAEEVATFYAKYLETDYPKKENFNTNFWSEFKTYLTPEQKKIVKDFNKADFTHIHKYLVEQKELKAQKTPEQKKADKEEKERLIQKYGYAIVSGHRQRISNWAIERPGLFLGRGKHPKTGLVKKRVEAEDITINIGKGVAVPEPPPGHKWGKIVHDDTVAWLAMWKENINNGFKYVWLHASSAVKGQSDMKKFEVARKLKDLVGKIRKKYTADLEAEDLEVRQRATALYFIDKLALRVGNEKDEETADTVGCCSLRVEHVTLKEPASVTLDFLGKDSMRYLNTVDVDKQVFKNLQEFITKPGTKKSPKKPDSDLFDQLTTASLNKYLKEFMPNLSAKVFRTFNASLTLEKELAKMPASIKNATNDEKVLFYNRCNREVAILCNHQRTQSKTHGESMSKIDDAIAGFERKKARLHQQILYLKGKGKKPESDSESEEESTPKKATPKKAAVKKESKKEKEEDDFATPTKKRKKGDEEEDDFKETPKKKVKRALPDNVDKCKAAIERVDASIKKWNVKKTEKEELKNIALTTSKINYIDPRITASWAKKVGLPMEKLFSKSLREKFPWAMDVDEDWKF